MDRCAPALVAMRQARIPRLKAELLRAWTDLDVEKVMRDVIKLALLTLFLSLSLAASVRAGPREDADAAFARGNYATALRLLRPLADHDEPIAQYDLGVMYAKGQGVPQDYAEAVKWFRTAADHGHSDAQYSLGVMYANGQGVPQEYAEAARWYRKAADQGEPSAQYSLGLMYDKGQGVPRDNAEAMTWVRKAAEQGDPKAETALGVMYGLKGLRGGVLQDLTEAMKWLRKAADQDDPDAQYQLGDMYATGKEYAEAMKWLSKAAEHGVPKAQTDLATMYTNGQGVPQDYVQAHKWFNLAASQFSASESEGRAAAVKSRDRLAAKMTPEQIAEAQKLAREWKPK